MVVGTYTRTSKDVSEGDTVEQFASNSNAVMQEASVFLAGRLSSNFGTFTQITYSGVEKKTSLDQLDLRYARSVQLNGKDSTIGLSLNNNPSLTDPFNTLGQWRFPYVSSDFGMGYGSTPLLENLGGGVAGINPYLFYDDSIYAEVGVYTGLAQSTTDFFNTDHIGKFKGPATYWRLAYFDDRKKDNFSLGLVGLYAGLQPDRNALGVTDKYRDLGVDASYQLLGNRVHIATVNASYIKEWQTLDYTQGVAGEASSNRGSLNQFRIAANYYFQQTWGGTVGYFDSRGNLDANRYPSSLSGRPDTSGYVLQADWTPWGKEDSWGAPWANVRLGLQYTGYNRFMGGSSYLNADGMERRAKDNNTVMLFLWAAI